MTRQEWGGSQGVVCTRNGVVESVHRIHAVVMSEDGRSIAGRGDSGLRTVYRSAAKPFQAIPLVTDGVVGHFGIPDRELALAAASHNGEPGHLAGVAEILGRVGRTESDLKLGPLAPLNPEAAETLLRSGEETRPIHNNCSGQHAAMLGLALIHDWPLETYLDPQHPLQERMLQEMRRFTGLPRDDIALVVDGCGMQAFGVPLREVALSFARLGGAASRREPGPSRVLGAMASNPFMVGGTGRLCSALPEVTAGRIVGKIGAEGVYGMTVAAEGLGIALKVEDGAMRAVDGAATRVLDLLGLLSPSESDALEPFRRQVVRDTRGTAVGEIRAGFQLHSGGGQ